MKRVLSIAQAVVELHIHWLCLDNLGPRVLVLCLLGVPEEDSLRTVKRGSPLVTVPVLIECFLSHTLHFQSLETEKSPVTWSMT